MQVRKQELELDVEQQTGSKQEKEYVKAVYCHPAYLTYMQSTQDWKRLVFIQIPKKVVPKNAQTTAQLHSSHTLAK